MHLTLLRTSPRVAPGLLSWAGWSTVAAADRRLCADLAAPLAVAVAAAGHRVDPAPGDPRAVLEQPTEGEVVWLATGDEADTLPALLADVPGLGLDVLDASYDVPGARVLDLVTVMDRLRTDCPWDREQTHASLARYLLEETHEVLEAIDTGDRQHLREELGDLLLQVCFHARVAAEAGADGFTIDDVADGIVDKLVHRHPHVFDGLQVADADEVDRNWEALKAAEKGRASVLDGIPLALPALALADKVLGRAARAGVEATPGAGLGDRLLTLVGEARAAGVDPEQALRGSVRELTARVRAAERQAGAPTEVADRGSTS